MRKIHFYLLLATVLLISACGSSSISNTTTPTTEKDGVLNIETAIIYAIGGVQPVAREEFYLLDKDLVSIFKEVEPNRKENELISNFALWYKLGDVEKQKETIRQHIKYKGATDLQGKAQFQNVQPNTYYIYGITSTRSGMAVWNLKTTVKSGQNSEILDSKNAADIF